MTSLALFYATDREILIFFNFEKKVKFLGLICFSEKQGKKPHGLNLILYMNSQI